MHDGPRWVAVEMTADNRKTERERAALGKLRNQCDERAVRVKVPEGGGLIRTDHPDEATGYAVLMAKLGTTDFDFLIGLLGQLVDAGSSSPKLDDQRIDFMLSAVKGIEPRDQVEAMLAAQMAAIHVATMRFARRLANVENIPQQDSAERAFNKLARTFAAQMEALKRYRTGGEQKVTVQHVTVGEGGQAIVGNVTRGGQQRQAPTDKAPASQPLLADAKTAPMPPILQEHRTQTPVRRRKNK
jgi:hypothetical protein